MSVLTPKDIEPMLSGVHRTVRSLEIFLAVAKKLGKLAENFNPIVVPLVIDATAWEEFCDFVKVNHHVALDYADLADFPELVEAVVQNATGILTLNED